MWKHDGIFYATLSLLCRCSNTVVTFYTLFNIETISYWSLRKFSHFFASFVCSLLLLLFLLSNSNVCSLNAEEKKFIKVNEEDKKQL